MNQAPETKTISPAKGCRVLDPQRGTPIVPDTDVVWDSYWQRKLDDGDVVIGAPAKGAAK